MRAKFINEKFEHESDPIEDMGIGITSEEWLNIVLKGFNNIGLYPKIEQQGVEFDTEHDEIITFIFQPNDRDNVVVKKVFDPTYYELLFAATNSAARRVVKDGKRGFYYYNAGEWLYLKGAKTINDIIKRIYEIREISSKVISNDIKNQRQHLITSQKIKKILDES